ncbi:MAG: helix-turn-helix domain-containing protein [Acidobacteria bacterium]|nr:helix-turn-helix domain-containing protein [Acidobacteriota bacterium]
MNTPRRWLTVRQAGELFQVSPKTLFSLIGRGRLPAEAVLRIGRQIRLDVAALEAGLVGKPKGRHT